jgi:hypothetical protein
VEEKINVLQQQLENSRQNSPAASPRAIAGSLERYDLKRGASPRGVNRKLDLSSYNSAQPNATCVSWSLSIVLSFLNEVAPYALVCALTGMLARSGPPAMPVSVTQLGAFAAVLATTQFGCGLLYTLVVSVFVSHLQSAVADRCSAPHPFPALPSIAPVVSTTLLSILAWVGRPSSTQSFRLSSFIPS